MDSNDEQLIRDMLIQGLERELVKHHVKSSGEIDHIYIDPESQQAKSTFEQCAKLTLEMLQERKSA
jgi:hypothetical protein